WAQSDLADYYFDGLVIDKDYRTAAFWYQKAAEQGYAPAQTNLGWLYFNGYDGIAPNRAVAIYWFGEAASQGNQTAANNLRALGESVPSNTGG
ncbi:MAG: tetratricopeptide repeat protein, partial [Arenicellales bacterium]